MAAKKKSDRVRQALKDLSAIERDIERVRANLRKFLDQPVVMFRETFRNRRTRR